MSNTKEQLDEAAEKLKQNLKVIKEKEREGTEKLLKKLNEATSELKTVTKNSADLIEEQANKAAAEEERKRQEEEEKRQKEEQAKKFLDKVKEMCNDPKSTKKSIDTKLKEIKELDDIKYNEGKKAFETFVSNVESQEKAIK